MKKRKIEDIRVAIRQSPHFAKIRDATQRFLRSLRYSDERIQNELAEKWDEPERYLSVHAGVWNAKSSRCQTLKGLADSIINDLKLPMTPKGMFRFDGYGLDHDQVEGLD